MTRNDLMQFTPEDAPRELEWESIEYLFRPRTQLELLLRWNFEGMRDKIYEWCIGDFPGAMPHKLRPELKAVIAREEFYRRMKLLREPRIVDLGVFGITIEYIGSRAVSVKSNLRKTYTCYPADPNYCNDYNRAVSGLEALLLALAGAGVDVTTPQIKEAIETAVEGIGNSL